MTALNQTHSSNKCLQVGSPLLVNFSTACAEKYMYEQQEQ